MNKVNKNKLIETIKNGGIAVMPTDTIYGLVSSAFNKKAVQKIYKIKNRSLNKPLIILISSYKELEKFGIILDAYMKQIIKKYWPGKVSIVFPVVDEKFSYLTQNKSLAFRLPSKESLKGIIRKTGPLVAPSANKEGDEPAQNIEEAYKYFKNKVNAYYGNKNIKGKASKLIKISPDGKISVLRK